MKGSFASCSGYESHTQILAHPQTIYWPLMFSSRTCSSLHIWFSGKGSTNASNFSHVAKRLYSLWFQPYGCELDCYILLLWKTEVNWIAFVKSHWHVNRAFIKQLLEKKTLKSFVLWLFQSCHKKLIVENFVIICLWLTNEMLPKNWTFWWKLPLQT
jgi:hypothetical protein